MLTARRIPKACQSCRLQLLMLFEHGFSTPSPAHLLKRPLNLRKSRTHPRSSRLFSTTRKSSSQETSNSIDAATFGQPTTGDAAILAKATSTVANHEAAVEETVRHARQTFGETLPKDFLSEEEFRLYVRLYGKPVRETRGEDLEILEEQSEETGKENVASSEKRSVLLLKGKDGEIVEMNLERGKDMRVAYEIEEQVEKDGEMSELEGMERLGEVQPEEQAILEEEAEELAPLTGTDISTLDFEVNQGEEAIRVQAKSQREVDAILRLQRDVQVAAEPPIEEEDLDEEIEEYDEEDDLEQDEDIEDDPDYLSSDSARTHPNTMAGRFGTSPSTLYLPKEKFVLPFTELLSRVSNKHLSAAAEKAFGGPRLPHSSSTPKMRVQAPQKHIGLEAGQNKMSEIEADAYIAAVIPGVYASVMATLVEIRKRLGSEWLRDLILREGGEGPRILDAGAGGAGILAWRQMLDAEWDLLRDEGKVQDNSAPTGKSTVWTGPSTLRHRISKLLENTTFLPRLPDYIHSAHPEALLDGGTSSGRKSYDIIIAPHTLLPLKDDFKRKNMIENLWTLLDPKGGILILIEKGLPRGFEAIAGARSHFLEKHISSPGSTHVLTSLSSNVDEQLIQKEIGMIIAPCTNHTTCPMYPVPGLSPGRKDYCHFSQRFIRPPYLQRLVGSTDRNHEDIMFSYLAVRRGVDSRQLNSDHSVESSVQGEAATQAAFEGFDTTLAPEGEIAELKATSYQQSARFNPLALPRAVLPPIKRHGHVTLDLCTPSGTLERWTVSRSFSPQAYRDARKSKWGDLWALGAKTRVTRAPRLGRVGFVNKSLAGKKHWKGRDVDAAQRKKRKGKDVFEVEMGEEGLEGIKHVTGKTRDRSERRTKGGRLERKAKEIRDDDW